MKTAKNNHKKIHPHSQLLEGILQPIFNQNFEYRLLTEDQVVNLFIPSKFQSLFKQHEWESIIVKGRPISEDVFFVKAVILKPEIAPLLEDLTQNFDMHIYEKMIQQGEPLMPMAGAA